MDDWAMVPGAGVSPRNLLGMQIIKSHSTPIQLEAVGVGLSNLCFKALWVIPMSTSDIRGSLVINCVY